MEKMKTLLKPEQINSKYFKKQLMSELFYRLNFPIVVDEHNWMDVFGIRRSGYMVEYEIKISKSDLMREIKLMNGEQPIKYSKDWVKWEKHAHYLKREIIKQPSIYDSIPGYSNNVDIAYFMPNEFYFYVPDFLAECAVRETVNTPYGVVKIGEKILPNGNSYFDRYDVVKPAKKLHTDKVTASIYEEVAHELTIRNRIFYLQQNNL